MTILQAFLQGMLQGLTEFLPVSSSGHLSLFQYLTGQSGENAFAFSILLHAGTLVAVVACFFRTICNLVYEALLMAGDLLTGRFRQKPLTAQRRTVLYLLLSTLPLGLMIFIKDFVERFSTDRDITVEGFCFLITATLLLLASRRRPGKKDGESIAAGDALVVGCAQVLATMPGISRSGATISAGLLRGFSRDYAVSYSFILGIPAVLGATVLEVKDAVQAGGLDLPISIGVIGFVSAVVFGILSIKLVQWLVKGDKFRYFGYYTLALGIVVLVVGFIDQFTGYPIQQFFSSLSF